MPIWEDPANLKGSEYACRKTMAIEQLDLCWENLVLSLIGETLDDGDEICGIRLVDKSIIKRSPKALYKFELWLRGQDEEVNNKIKQKLTNCLVEGSTSPKSKLPKLSFEFDYKLHKNIVF